MKKCNKICIITDRYPLKNYPVNTFLEQLVCGFVDNGVECDVIAPYCSFMDKLRRKHYSPQKHNIYNTLQGNKINVYCPTFFCLSGRRRLGIDFSKIYQQMHYRAALKVLQKINKKYDAFYAHFVVPSALTAAQLGCIYNKPVFFAYGESSIDNIKSNFDLGYVRNRLKTVSGVVAVSNNNRDELIANKIVDAEKIEVFPNAINNSLFCVMNKKNVREKFGIQSQDFVVAFVGHFIDRKGSRRLSDALKRLDGVKSIFIGDGPDVPDCDGIIFAGRVAHDKISTYLNAADVFVLPTLAEGCCNAIIEAMACGLPVVSSDLPFNDDILNETNSIRINPRSIDEIVVAINTLKDSPSKCRELSEGAIKTAQKLTIDSRAKNIIEFINKGCRKY